MKVTAAHQRTAGAQRVMILVVVMLAAAVYEINLTNATVALPYMQGTFSATQDQISWVMTAFIVGMTAGFAWAGWCAERFGRKQFLMISLILYTVSSAFCGAATGLNEEVAWRFAQGAAGSPLMPLSQAIVLDNFPRRRHGTANVIWGMAIMLGPVSGPVVGGYLTEFYGWPWIFYFNVPLGLLIIPLCWFLVPADRPKPDRHFDWLGFASLIAAAAAIQLVLNRGGRLDWFGSTEIVIESAVAVLALYVFVVHSVTTRRPFLELAIFRDRNMATGLILVMVWGFLLHGAMVLLSLMMQDLRGYPVLTLGLVLAPRSIGVMLGMFVAGRLVRHLDPRYVMAFELSCMAVSAWAMSLWNANVTSWEVIWTGTLQGFSTGCGFIPLAVMTYSTIDRRYRTEAITFFNLLLFASIGAGIAVAINIMIRSTTIVHATLVEHVTPFNELFRYFSMPSLWDPTSAAGLAALDSEITRQAAMVGYLNYFHLVAIMAALSVPLAFLFTRHQPTDDD